jgi:hypothetical protein
LEIQTLSSEDGLGRTGTTMAFVLPPIQVVMK